MASRSISPVAPRDGLEAAAARRMVVLTGNPNCGKTTLFNALTGLRARVGNYAGVTVERKEGRLLGTKPPRAITVLDLPGTYSLSPQSLDEQIARDVLLGRLDEVPAPGLVVVVVDASNLERNLYYAAQVIELGYPTVLALNMMDVARDNGHLLDAVRLEQELGVPVFPLVASTREGVPALRDKIVRMMQDQSPPPNTPRFEQLPAAMAKELEALVPLLGDLATRAPARARAEALLLLSDERNLAENAAHHPPPAGPAALEARRRLETAGVDWRTVVIEARYDRVRAIHDVAVTETQPLGETTSDRLDRVFTHRIWGTGIFLALMALMFQSIFSLAQVPMDLLEGGVGWVGLQVANLLPPGDLRSLLVDGAIAGVGAVVVFLPQICLLFLFLGILEDTGYMARAAFLMDRLMSKVGLHGKSFIPMLSSFACAIPGIMATRTIEHPKDRLVTILIAPLMSCSARLPVYTLLIAACIPDRRVLGVFGLPGLTMLGMYLLGIVLALGMAWIFKKTLLRGHTPLLILELPPFKRPTPGGLFRHTWERAKLFLTKAGTVILGFNILLWFLASYPRPAAIEAQFEAARTALVEQNAAGKTPTAEADDSRETPLADLERELAGERIRHSYAGRLGHAIEPIIRPLGFDWKMGIGIVTSFAAREIFVSTMSVVYSMGGGDSEAEVGALAARLQDQKHPDGRPVYTALTGMTLMVFYVVALQCASTVAVVRRETNSWKWPLFQWVYLGVLAWCLAFLTHWLGRALGAA
jgi:ferrous iron transport protein B